MIKLNKMISSDYDKYIKIAIPDYAEDKIKSGAWKKEEALKLSEQTFLEGLPERQETENEFLFCISLENETIGYVWFHFNDKESTTAFIYDFLILEEYQNQGHGSKAMTCIEEAAHEAGAKKLGLHVFAHNKRAVHVYEKSGFEFTDFSMTKDL